MLIIANVVVFVATQVFGGTLIGALGFHPVDAVARCSSGSSPPTGGFGHILFNTLALWMFGTELERRWGSRCFLQYYVVCGVGAALTTVVFTMLPVSVADQLSHVTTAGV